MLTEVTEGILQLVDQLNEVVIHDGQSCSASYMIS